MEDRAIQTAKLERSIGAVIRWVEARHYRGHDPADGNASPLRYLTFGRVLPRRILQQAVLRAPFNIRPWVGIRPLESTKGRGYMAWGYAVMFRRTGEARYRDGARVCLQWLIENRAPRHAQAKSPRAARIPPRSSQRTSAGERPAVTRESVNTQAKVMSGFPECTRKPA